MVQRRSTQLVLVISAATWLTGCTALPVNRMRLVGSRSLDLVGRYPGVVEFDRGEFVRRGRGGIVVMTGPQAALLFDYDGPGNRFDLLLREGDQTVLYRRIDQRAPASAAGLRVRQAGGVSIDREDSQLTGAFDVALERDDLRGFGPAFEHYPKHLSVSAKFKLPRCLEPVGPTSQPSPFWPPPHVSPGTASTGLADIDPRWLLGRFAPDLPPLRPRRGLLGGRL